MGDKLYFILNIVLGIIFACVPLAYSFYLKQKPHIFGITGAVVSVLVVFFAGWLISLLSAAFFCFMIYNEQKKRDFASRVRIARESRNEELREQEENPEYSSDVWSDELIGKFNENKENENKEEDDGQ
ncbi:MAG: hypothetical protein IJL87_06805 [Clostridia bacterium]|nr:hypothetical protein [Clostridia bacterium]